MAHTVAINDDVARLTLSGDIDLQVSGNIKSEIERLRDVSRLEIDASDVSYIDSSGVAILILARQYCAQNNITLALPSISAAVHRVLRIARLDVMLPIGDVAGASASEEFALDEGEGAPGADLADGGDFGSDDDLVNSLLSDEGPAIGGAGEQITAINDDLATDDITTGDLATDDLATGDLATDDLATDDHIGDDLVGNFDGLDIDSVDFSEPAKATASPDSTDEEVDPSVEDDSLKPGTFN